MCHTEVDGCNHWEAMRLVGARTTASLIIASYGGGGSSGGKKIWRPFGSGGVGGVTGSSVGM